MSAPTLRPDGSCPDCAHGWQCRFHQVEGVRRFSEREAMLRELAISMRAAEIDRICARYELESDEFLTANQKAQAILSRP